MKIALATAMLAFGSPAYAGMTDALLYTLHCSGCHGATGHGIPSAGIPDLHDAGAYAALPEGRTYLAQVPGIAQSRLDNETAARMLNWVLTRFAAAALPPGFIPYNAAEIGRLRTDAASDAETRRARVVALVAHQSAPLSARDALR